jgi:hypothetical protein
MAEIDELIDVAVYDSGWVERYARDAAELTNAFGAGLRAGASVYSKPDLQSPVLIRVTEAGGEGTVLTTATGQREKVWDQIRLSHPAGHTGFVHEAELLSPDGFCVDPEARRD